MQYLAQYRVYTNKLTHNTNQQIEEHHELKPQSIFIMTKIIPVEQNAVHM